ncbi:hypothetical protein JOQ06_011685, partial [Pogonophryne albipinna]
MKKQIPLLTRAVRKERTLQQHHSPTEHHEETDPSPDPRCEEGKNTPAAPQFDQPSTPVQNKIDQQEKADGTLSKPTAPSAPK